MNMIEGGSSNSNFKTADGVGKAILFIIVGAIGVGLYYLMPFLIQFIKNIFVLGGMLALLGIILYVAFDPKIRLAISNWYQNMVRKLVGKVISSDPIGMLRNYETKLKGKRVKINEDMGTYNGEKIKLAQKVKENEGKIDKCMQYASAAKAQLERETDEIKRLQLDGSITSYTQEAGLLRDSNAKIQPLLDVLTKLYNTLQKMYIQSEFLLKNLSTTIEIKQSEYEALKSGTAIIKSAGAIYGDGGSDEEIFNQSMEWLRNDIGHRWGEIDRFLENTIPTITNIEVQKGAAKAEGLRMLEEFEKNSLNKIFNTPLGQPKPVTVVMEQNQAGTYVQAKTQHSNLLED